MQRGIIVLWEIHLQTNRFNSLVHLPRFKRKLLRDLLMDANRGYRKQWLVQCLDLL